MRVKVGNKFYDTKNEPIMLILSRADKYEICHLDRDEFIVCSYPESLTPKQVDEFMDCKEWREELGSELSARTYPTEP
jgi:hypothetical protein